ncbi:hypothetical protein ACF0H5_018897 [Mactra antiquata]
MKKVRTRPTYLKGVLHGGLAIGSLWMLGRVLDARAKYREMVEEQERQLIIPTLPTDDEEMKRMKAARGQEILKYGIPDNGKDVRYYSNHVLLYDQQKRIPTWVAEHISANILKGSADRRHVKFRPDPEVEERFSAQNGDYWRSGWSRGHMAPAGDNRKSQEAMQDSFNLTNVVPQNLENNAGFWNRLEIYCRDLTNKFSNVFIISGPLMLPIVDEDGNKYVKYQVIGENNVAVPTHLFKVIIVEDKKRKPKAMGAFVVPNEPIGYDKKLTDYLVDLEALEKSLGVTLVPKLIETEGNVKNLCKVDNCKLIGRKEFELYFIGRKLESANTLHRLETVWNELEEKKLKPDRYLKELYKQKKSELTEQEKLTGKST